MVFLTNKTALITGASRAIGRATASVLANAGAQLLVHYGRSVQDAESHVAGIRSKGGRADAVRADLRTPDGAILLAREVPINVNGEVVETIGVSGAPTGGERRRLC